MQEHRVEQMPVGLLAGEIHVHATTTSDVSTISPFFPRPSEIFKDCSLAASPASLFLPSLLAKYDSCRTHLAEKPPAKIANPYPFTERCHLSFVEYHSDWLFALIWPADCIFSRTIALAFLSTIP